MLIVETDSDPAVWFHMPLRGTKAEFAHWLGLQLKANAMVHRRRLTWREKRRTRKLLESSAVMLRDSVKADQAFLFGPMPPQVSPLVLFTKQFACDEEHSHRHLSMLAEPDPSATSLHVETTPFVSSHFGEGLRCVRSWTRPDGGPIIYVAYAWNDAARDIDLVLKGHYDDPEILEASMEAIDDFARSIWIA
ncbi:hypothetical protein ACFWBR_34455 [Streptomyces sp. NPDC060006]|uniref:hypothetical protein n=1 Tax=unclassified Streptomyces TaxID=2593676 RepID=UPI00363FB30D